VAAPVRRRSAILDRTIRVEGHRRRPPGGFSFPDRAEAWVPAAKQPGAYLTVIARLRPACR
jgi:hypothetical protein